MALRKSNPSENEWFNGKHRSEHWYRDNTIYFLTARCRNRYPAFASEQAKAIFWDRFNHYAAKYQFQSFIISLLDNHYHCVGYLQCGQNLGPMMRQLHGSIAKLVNDLLPTRQIPFWKDNAHNNYFDGCLRDEQQYRRAYRYMLTQSVRHGIVTDHRTYPHTRIFVELHSGLDIALRQNCFLPEVPYERYTPSTGGGT